MNIICRRADKPLSDVQLKEIAGLIYDSDPYIYPAMFESRRHAENIIPKMIRAGDQMFKCDNIYAAMDGTKIAGVLVWMRGPLQWNKKIYEKCGGRAKHIDRVVMEYFNLFEEAPSDMNTMVRISVKKELQGNHIGSMLMQTFMEAEQGPYQLFVLSNNAEAISFFQKKGFRIRETRPGFSLDYQVPPCFWMTKI
jgi:GNAT superfamily N-acetyltransferase